ncbi:MAG TPA: alpha/beta hydrolase [Candidatus Elarobacter sp.]|nr:alpha/beta hydrolase [Candidatus Elarobacter sp.]
MLTSIVRACMLAAALPFALAPAGAAAAPLSAAPNAGASFDGGSIAIDRYGKGDAVVLLPGLTAGPWEWYDTIRHLEAHHTVYVISLPGFDGRATVNPPLFDRFTSDFWSFINTQHVARPVIIGHSLGGTLAILLAEQHPDRLRGIIALDGMPIFPGMEKVTPEQRAAGAQQAATAIAAETHDQLLAYDKTYMSGPGGVLDPALADQLADLTARSDPGAAAEWLREDLSADLRPDLSKITVPLLEIAPYNQPDLANSTHPYTADQKAQYYQTLLAGAPKLQVIPLSPARHFAMFDQPQQFFALVDAFLAQNK